MLILTGLEVAETLRHLQSDGALGHEGVVLWLGSRDGDRIRVREVLRPQQEARSDWFRIPSHSMAAIMARLRNENLMIAAQVHSHPGAAFHSRADDEWAIVRHVGALSLVLPTFARFTSVATFLRDAAVFVVDDRGTWVEADVAKHLGLIA
jgi:proteasome lid subunit RPN8/RPN11